MILNYATTVRVFRMPVSQMRVSNLRLHACFAVPTDMDLPTRRTPIRTMSVRMGGAPIGGELEIRIAASDTRTYLGENLDI